METLHDLPEATCPLLFFFYHNRPHSLLKNKFLLIVNNTLNYLIKICYVYPFIEIKTHLQLIYS